MFSDVCLVCAGASCGGLAVVVSLLGTSVSSVVNWLFTGSRTFSSETIVWLESSWSLSSLNLIIYLHSIRHWTRREGREDYINCLNQLIDWHAPEPHTVIDYPSVHLHTCITVHGREGSHFSFHGIQMLTSWPGMRLYDCISDVQCFGQGGWMGRGSGFVQILAVNQTLQTLR